MSNVLFRRGDQTFIDENVPLNDGQIIFNETDEAIYVDNTINGTVVRKRYGGGNLSRSDVDSALSTSSTNPIQNQAVATALNGKAPTSHASTATTYGVGTTTNYGHCMTINDLNTSSHANGKALSAYQGKVLNDKISKTEVLISNVESSIATVQTTLTASKAYAVGEQFVYNGLLYKATATIAQGGTITIGGNCALAGSVTGQIISKNNYNFRWDYEETNIMWLNNNKLYSKIVVSGAPSTSEYIMYTETNPNRSIVFCELLWVGLNGRALSPNVFGNNLNIEWTSTTVAVTSLPNDWYVYVRIWAN